MGNWSSTPTEEEEEAVAGEGGRAGGTRLYQQELRGDQWPIIYSSNYDIGFLGLQKIHPFDSAKWGKIYRYLSEGGLLQGTDSVVTPQEVTRADLLVAHTTQYLDSLNYSYQVAMVVEVPPVAILPNFIVQRRLLRPFRYQTGGTVLAGKLAKDRGWAINVGGGFHHCSSNEGGGFCAYADITLSIKFMFQHLDGIARVMIVDFDAHQGNGHERDFMRDDKVYIMDMYNRWIYPNDREAKRAIRKKIELDVHTQDDVYLDHIRRKLPEALDEFQPNMVVYNAGTDILEGDPLGILDITPNGVVQRDELVFREVRRRGIPIFMVTSGGYQRNNARVIADSILNLRDKRLISAPGEDPHISEQLGEEADRLREEEEREEGEEEDGEAVPAGEGEGAKRRKVTETREDAEESQTGAEGGKEEVDSKVNIKSGELSRLPPEGEGEPQGESQTQAGTAAEKLPETDSNKPAAPPTGYPPAQETGTEEQPEFDSNKSAAPPTDYPPAQETGTEVD